MQVPRREELRVSGVDSSAKYYISDQVVRRTNDMFLGYVARRSPSVIHDVIFAITRDGVVKTYCSHAWGGREKPRFVLGGLLMLRWCDYAMWQKRRKVAVM